MAVLLAKVVMCTPNDDKANDLCVKRLIQFYKVTNRVQASLRRPVSHSFLLVPRARPGIDGYFQRVLHVHGFGV